MARKLFCELCPLTYELSRWKGIVFRHLQDLRCPSPFARSRREEPLPVLAYRHASLIRRRLGNVDMRLQENKAVNLRLAAPKVSGVLIRPGEVFSFWRLVGATSVRKGYREGLMIKRGQPSQGIGGGLCQFTNLLHWLALHSPLRIVEYHHHDGVDLFPDCGRQIPFGIGTSISYNYLDYRFQNPTGATFQLLVWTTDTHLCGELRADVELPLSWHIRSEEEAFVRDGIGYTGTMSLSASAWTRGAATCCRAKPSSGTMRWCCMRCRKIGLWKRAEGRARAPFSPPSRLGGRKIGSASVLQGDAQTAFRMSSPGKKKPGTIRCRASFICCRLSRERPSFRTLQTSA